MPVATQEKRGQWGSKMGFILAASGSAVGLGNIWRFPYVTGENGGGAFVVIYLICVLLIGLPLLYNEIGLGRLTGKNPIGAVASEKPKSFWIASGILCVLLCFFVLSYYSVIAGWTIGYMISSFQGATGDFETFAASPGYVIGLMGVFMLFTIAIILGGVSSGIEKAAKILMPVLLVIIVAIIIKSLTFKGAMRGVEYFLVPDFTKINGTVVLQALGQAFFSMSVGWGLMITYGSYLSKKEDMVTAGVWIAFFDTGVAILGGLLVFPAVFAFGQDPDGGATLVFQILPRVFEQMPMGNIVGAFFFLLLMLAALTSSISMLEVPVSYFIDQKKWGRKKAAWTVGIAAFVVGIPSALSAGGVAALSPGGWFGEKSFLDMMDMVWGTWGVVLVCLSLSVFTGWVIGPSRLIKELGMGSSLFSRPLLFGITPAQLWGFFIRYVCPVVIFLMIVFQVSE